MPLLLPLSGHPSEASDNDNVAFGIPTDLETGRSSERGKREERSSTSVAIVVVVSVVERPKYSLAKNAAVREF